MLSLIHARAVAAALLIPLLTGASAARAPQTPAPYSVLSAEGRQPLPVRSMNGQEMFALDDLARLFGLAVREDTLAGGLTIAARGGTIVLTPGQELASVDGRLISLPAPPARDGRAWFVPVDFVSRALAPVAGARIELRKASRLILLGDIRVPRIAGRVERHDGHARITLDVAPSTPHVVTQEANRLIVRFEADTLDASLPASTIPELVQGLQLEPPSTIAVDLGPRFTAFRTSDLPGERGGTRIVIDVLGQTTEQPPVPSPAPPSTPQETPPLLDLTPPGTLRSVVIDAGHGGADHGVRGPGGLSEKDVTLAVARRLKGALEGRLGVRVILTRDGDDAVGLDQRASIANNNKADLFISLHANASVRPGVTGAVVYHLDLEEYGEEAMRAAAARRESLAVFGGGTRDIEVVAWRFAQARHIRQSAALAQRLTEALATRVPMSARRLEQAPLRVLVGANMPAVLVEMGFLSNPEQEKQLGSGEYQNAVVQAIVEAVVQFRDANAGAGR